MKTEIRQVGKRGVDGWGYNIFYLNDGTADYIQYNVHRVNPYWVVTRQPKGESPLPVKVEPIRVGASKTLDEWIRAQAALFFKAAKDRDDVPF